MEYKKELLIKEKRFVGLGAILVSIFIFPFFTERYTLQIVSFGSIFIGFLAGILSNFFVLKRRSILGDTLSHSTLTGAYFVFLLILEKNIVLLLLGALISALLAMFLVSFLSELTELKQDTIIAVVLSIFFGLAMVFLTSIQQSGVGSQSGLSSFLVGEITFILRRDVELIIFFTLLTLILVVLFWKEFVLVTFDPLYAKSAGIDTKRYEILLLVIITITIVLGVYLIGAVIIAGLMIAPSLSARQWTNNFTTTAFLGGVIGAFAGLIGSWISANEVNTPTGPVIIIVLGIIAFLSVVFGIHNNIFLKNAKTRKLFKKILYSKQSL